MCPHFSLDDDITAKLESFLKRRGKNKSHWVRVGLDRLFSTEHPDSEKQSAVNVVIDRYFHVPKNIPYLSFYSFLYMLATNYPTASANDFWGEMHLSAQRRTHEELKSQLDDEIKRILSVKHNGKGA